MTESADGFFESEYTEDICLDFANCPVAFLSCQFQGEVYSLLRRSHL